MDVFSVESKEEQKRGSISEMADISRWQDLDDEDPYALSENDPLGVLSSTRLVVEQGEFVWINTDHVAKLAEQWGEQGRRASSPPSYPWDDRYHFSDGSERTANWILLLDALNFCFWPERDAPRWTIEYEGETLNGYWAEAASLTRAVAEGIPLWDAEYLSTIRKEEIEYIFRGTEEIPLLEERVVHAREVGRVLLERFDGQFVHAIEQAEGNAVKLTQLLARNFPSFHDVARYRNHSIVFLKRAQICVADLHAAFQGKMWGKVTGLEQLTAFADYKLPQVLRHYHVLEYHATLAERVDAQEPLAPGSEEELEIRAGTIWACELLRRSLLQQGCTMTNVEIDQRLWLLGQESSEMRPYHRTRTVYY